MSTPSNQSDRLFLEATCGSLEQKLTQTLIEGKDIAEQDFQDFEVSCSVYSGEGTLQLNIKYPFLAAVLQNGSQALLERVWGGLPLKLAVQPEQLEVSVETASLGEDAALRERCARQLLLTRVFLIIGPLVDKLIWLRDATAGGNRNTTVVNTGTVPPILCLQLRQLEHCWIICKADRVLVIFTVHLDDDGDVALGRAFCQEFSETNRKPSDSTLPCSFTEFKEPPADLAEWVKQTGQQVPTVNVGFLSLTLSDQCVRGASEERLHALAIPVMTFRNFFNFHLKNAKSYLHSRLRKRMEGWQQSMARAKRAPRKGKEETRRTYGGKVFVPKERA